MHCLTYNGDLVAFKMAADPALAGRSEPEWQEEGHISRLNAFAASPNVCRHAVRISHGAREMRARSIRNRSGRHRTVAGPFQGNPSGLRPIGCFSIGRSPDSLVTSRTSFALRVRMQNSRRAKLVRDARRYRQPGSDRLEQQPTGSAAADSFRA